MKFYFSEKLKIYIEQEFLFKLKKFYEFLLKENTTLIRLRKSMYNYVDEN